MAGNFISGQIISISRGALRNVNSIGPFLPMRQPQALAYVKIRFLRAPQLVAPAANRFAAHHDTTLEKEFFDVTQAELEAEIPTTA